MSGLKIDLKSCIGADLKCDDLNKLLESELKKEEAKIWVAECKFLLKIHFQIPYRNFITALITGSFDKGDSDGAYCEDLDEQTYDEPSSASTMTTMTVAIIALIKLF